MAHHTVDGILSGKIAAPAELSRILRDPEVARAYYGGAIGPDLSDSTHYKNTSEAPARMLTAARSDLAKATKTGNASQIKAARQELAFAYGWLNHSAADLNIHPVINSMIGDTYRYNNTAEKVVHAEIEAQFTRYLAHGQPMPSYDPIVPVEFVARTAFMSKAAVKEGISTLDLKATAEREYANTAAAIGPNLDGAFRLVEAGATGDNAAFLRNPNNFKNWDLDCGKISTNEFETLREATMRANGGKLPANWGSMYLTWNERTSGLVLDKKIKIMTAILLGAGVPPRLEPKNPPVDPAKIPKGGAWVLEKTEFTYQYPDSAIAPERKCKETGANGSGTAQANYYADPNITLVVKINVTWTVPDTTLIPGKSYKFRFFITDAGSDIGTGYLGGNGSFGANCPAMSDVWYGPAAGVDFHSKIMQAEATKEFIPKSAPDGTIMYMQATWTAGIRGVYYTYIYRFKAK